MVHDEGVVEDRQYVIILVEVVVEVEAVAVSAAVDATLKAAGVAEAAAPTCRACNRCSPTLFRPLLLPALYSISTLLIVRTPQESRCTVERAAVNCFFRPCATTSCRIYLPMSAMR